MALPSVPARRRGHYVGIVFWGTLLTLALIHGASFWVTVIVVVFLMGHVWDLAEIGFTARADNEQ